MKHLAATLCCSFAFALSLPAAAQPAPQEETNRAFITGAFAQWSAGGGTFFTDVLAPDVVWTIAGGSPMAGVYRGREDLLRRAVKPLGDRLATPIRPVVRHIWADGDDVIVQWDGTATARDGQPYRNSYVWILRMAGGRATAVTAFLDMAAYDAVLARVQP